MTKKLVTQLTIIGLIILLLISVAVSVHFYNSIQNSKRKSELFKQKTDTIEQGATIKFQTIDDMVKDKLKRIDDDKIDTTIIKPNTTYNL